MIRLHELFMKTGVVHTWVQGGKRAHGWFSGWMDGAIAGLDANAASGSMLDAKQSDHSGLQPARFGDTERNDENRIESHNTRRTMTTYRASVDFSSAQGFRNWYYLYGSDNLMTFNEGK